MIVHAFTCTGPYAMLILSGVKHVENRSAMPVPREGRCAISVSKRFSAKEYENFIAWANKTFGLAWCMTNLRGWEQCKVGDELVFGCNLKIVPGFCPTIVYSVLLHVSKCGILVRL